MTRFAQSILLLLAASGCGSFVPSTPSDPHHTGVVKPAGEGEGEGQISGEGEGEGDAGHTGEGEGEGTTTAGEGEGEGSTTTGGEGEGEGSTSAGEGEGEGSIQTGEGEGEGEGSTGPTCTLSSDGIVRRDLVLQSISDTILLRGCTEVTGSVTFTAHADAFNADASWLTSFQDFSTLTKIDGDFIIDGTAATDLTGLENLTEVGGIFGLAENPSLTSLHGLTSLAHIGTGPTAGQTVLFDNGNGAYTGGSLYLFSNPNLASLLTTASASGTGGSWPALQSTGGDFYLADNPFVSQCWVNDILGHTTVSGSTDVTADTTVCRTPF